MYIPLEEAITRLKRGEVVAIPTETVYGLAADASNAQALQKIYATKRRPSHNPLIVHIATAATVIDWAEYFPPLAQRLAAAFWPGPLTLVLKAKPTVLPIVTANQPTVALRVPDHPLTIALLTNSGLGLAAPSANQYTQLSPTRAEHVTKGLGADVPVLDGGPCTVGLESTIVEVFEDENQVSQWRILREGMLSHAQLTQYAQVASLDQTEQPRVPGQHRLHYAPVTSLQVIASREALISESETLIAQSKKVGAMLIGTGSVPGCTVLNLSQSPEAYAQALYAALHQLDALGLDTILVEQPPSTDGWAAILDRLTRAAHR